MRRTDETVILYARSGRIVTSNWMDLAVPAMALRPGTVIDGEAVIWRNGALDFDAVQSRAASSSARARALAAQHPAAYACWDVLNHPEIGDTRSLPYTRRRELLLELLDSIGPPIQPVPATDDRSVAEHWYESLQTKGTLWSNLHGLAQLWTWGSLQLALDAPPPGGAPGSGQLDRLVTAVLDAHLGPVNS